MTQMKQIEIHAYGNSDLLQVVEKSLPQPQAGELLIKVKAAGVNYSDILRRRNTYFMPTPLPYVLGAEAVGEIVARGEDVTEQPFVEGSPVLAILPSGGGYSEYVIAQAAYCVPLPPHVDAQAATALFVQGSTAHLLLHDVVRDLEGKTLLIHAGASGVGSLLIQLAKMNGAKVIATASSDEKLGFAKQIGADLTINYSSPNWTDQLIQANKGEKVNIVLEMIGGKIYEQSFQCLKPGGIMVVYGAASGEKGFVHSEHFVDENHQLRSFNLAHYIQQKTDVWQASLGAMISLLAEGKIQVSTPNNYPLSKAFQAHQDIENRLTKGKVVLIP